jgi:hypothetical protein
MMAHDVNVLPQQYHFDNSSLFTLLLAQAMMMYATIHWPNTSDTQLWLIAVQHATNL